jgi:carbonic anhydrase/acetyltransferase-like protein (isoleucine patch superfamily)
MIYQLNDRRVTLQGSGHYIAPNATVIGSVTLEKDVSIWFNVVIRADCDSIHIGEGTNIQDGTVLHVDPGFPVHIGRNVTVGHKAMIHGCSIGDGSLIGINAVVLDGAKIGKGCLIGANALVPAKMEVPDGAMVLGSPGKIKRILSEEEQSMLLHNADHYIANGQAFAQHLQAQDDAS